MFNINLHSGIPIYEQIKQQVVSYVSKGILMSDEKMPSVRNLSVELSVNPNTIARAYNELCTENILYSVAGKGVFVCENARNAAISNASQYLDEFADKATSLKEMGIEKNILIKCLDEIYFEGEKND